VSGWVRRNGQRVRFYNTDGIQVGPEHRNVAPAIVWAAFHGWLDPAQPALSLACTDEVRANSTFRAAS